MMQRPSYPTLGAKIYVSFWMQFVFHDNVTWLYIFFLQWKIDGIHWLEYINRKWQANQKKASENVACKCGLA